MRGQGSLVIVPTLNEARNIGLLLPAISENLPSADVLVVDDDSSDGTADRAREIGTTLPIQVHVEVRRSDFGLGRAYRHGFRWGLEREYRSLLTMDADLSHDPGYLPAMVDQLEHSDLVIGSRYVADGGIINWGIPRIVLSWSANRFAHLVLGLKGYDLTSGYRAYKRSVLETIDLATIRSDGYSFLVELLYHAQGFGCTVGEVPIIFVDRTHGQSKISKREIYRGAFTLLRLRLGRAPDRKSP